MVGNFSSCLFLIWYLIHSNWQSNSSFPNLMVQMFLPQIHQAPGPYFRKVGKSLIYTMEHLDLIVSTLWNISLFLKELDVYFVPYYIAVSFQGVLDRFSQIQPKVIFSVNAVHYNGKVHNHLDKLTKVVEGR